VARSGTVPGGTEGPKKCFHNAPGLREDCSQRATLCPFGRLLIPLYLLQPLSHVTHDPARSSKARRLFGIPPLLVSVKWLRVDIYKNLLWLTVGFKWPAKGKRVCAFKNR